MQGLIVSIDKDFLDHIVLRFAGGAYDFDTVDARLEDYESSQAASLEKGQVIKVSCIGGGMTISSPQLRHCTLL